MSLFFSAGSFRGLCVNDLVGVRRNLWWRIAYDDISTDGRERAVRVKANAISNKVSAVFKTLDLVDHSIVGQLGI